MALPLDHKPTMGPEAEGGPLQAAALTRPGGSKAIRLLPKGRAKRMGVRPTGVEIPDLGFRWGACGKAGVVNFHWATTLLPAGVVDYVVVHKLAHLVKPNHTEAF